MSVIRCACALLVTPCRLRIVNSLHAVRIHDGEADTIVERLDFSKCEFQPTGALTCAGRTCMSVAGPENIASATFSGEGSDMNVQATVIAALMTVTLGQTSMTVAWIFGPQRAACVSLPVHCASSGLQTGEETQVRRMDIHVRRMTQIVVAAKVAFDQQFYARGQILHEVSDKNVQDTGIALYRWADATPLAGFHRLPRRS